MLRINQRIPVRDIELVIVHVMQKHVDTRQVLGSQVNVLTVIPLPHTIRAQDLRGLKKQ